MSFANDNMVRTLPPGFLAPADGNYAPDGVRSADSGLNVAPGFSPAASADATIETQDFESSYETANQDAALKGGATEAAVDPGPNNERLEDLKPDLVNALRELVRQYRQEGIVARRHEIRRIRQARLFW